MYVNDDACMDEGPEDTRERTVMEVLDNLNTWIIIAVIKRY